MHRRPLLGAIALSSLVAGVLVASVIGSGSAHRPGVAEWVIQLVILAAAALMIAGRVRRKR